ncbi:hypothetical protein ENH_00013830 [Eimeria necatrix]|uniref:Uncharacterized protein n=1 Tax=Eimeria necatrix TaxID=51315 RepID=U6MDM1_9EIME|nr:hypothetical protein ENH_00013830 [Eimeria necatrix]CDJ62352.1 hypothetical protein ENH_00013830 [Eimeria necatrix]
MGQDQIFSHRTRVDSSSKPGCSCHSGIRHYGCMMFRAVSCKILPASLFAKSPMQR